MIPRIDVRMCNARKQYAGELDFEYDAGNDLIDIPYVSFSSPVRVRLSYEIFDDDSVDVKGSVAFSLKGLCSRCLAETEKGFALEISACFVPDAAQEDDEYEYRNGIVNLEELLRDSVLVALPPLLACEACDAE